MFDADLITGKNGEMIAERYLRKNGATDVFHTSGWFPEFDIIAVYPRGHLEKVEIKLDRKCEQTNNIAFEYEHHNQDKTAKNWTGILLTRADTYLIIAKGRVIRADADELFYFLHENKNNFRIVEGGDGDQSVFILVPYEILVSQPWVKVWNYKKEIEEKYENAPQYLHEVG